MINEAIILAGGLGTRLHPVISDQPKCMAPIAGKPFMSYLINYLRRQGIQKFIFSVGYMHEVIEDYLKNNYAELSYTISFEDKPLGTGGAIKLACEKTSAKNVLVCNGDTLFKVNISAQSEFHLKIESACTIALKPMSNFNRYGVVELNENSLITTFKEKQFYKSGLINGGVYTLHIASFLDGNLPKKFSFEKDYLEKEVSQKKFYGIVEDEYFIDIGIPEDYAKAQEELKAMN